MDYEKKYKEALECIRVLYNSDCDMIRVKRLRRRLELIFPELKESDDERIKKQIRELLLDSPSNDLCRIGIDVEKTLAWLEKRGEKDKPKEWCAEDEQNLNVVLSFIPDECLRRWLKDKLSYDLNNKLDADKVIAWLVANICDFEYYVKLFKKDFGL